MWQHTDGRIAGALPQRMARNADGEWSTPTPETAAEFGWSPVTKTDRPDADPWDSVSYTVVDGVQVWTVTEGVEPLVASEEMPPEDERVATDALLTRDSVALRTALELFAAKFNALTAALAAGDDITAAHAITPAEQAAAARKGLERLVQLTAPEVRRPMMAMGLAEAEAVRAQIEGGR